MRWYLLAISWLLRRYGPFHRPRTWAGWLLTGAITMEGAVGVTAIVARCVPLLQSHSAMLVALLIMQTTLLLAMLVQRRFGVVIQGMRHAWTAAVMVWAVSNDR